MYIHKPKILCCLPVGFMPSSPLTILLVMKSVLLWLHSEFISPLFILARVSPSVNEQELTRTGGVMRIYSSWGAGRTKQGFFPLKKRKKSLWSNKIPVLIDYICIIKWNSPTMAFAWIVNWWTVIVITRVCWYSQCIIIKFTWSYFQSLAGLRGMFPLLQSPGRKPHLINLFCLGAGQEEESCW